MRTCFIGRLIGEEVNLNFRTLPFELRTQGLNFFLVRKKRFFSVYYPFQILNFALSLGFAPISCIAFFLRYRFADIYDSRIGHQIVEYYYSWTIAEKKNYKMVVCLNETAANKEMVSLYRCIVVKGSLATTITRLIFWWPFLQLPTEQAVRTSRKVYSIKPYRPEESFAIPDNWLNEANLLRKALGFGEKRICVVHARSRGYSPIDDERFSYRNCSFSNYDSVFQFIVSKGFHIVNFGSDPLENSGFPCGDSGWITEWYAHPWRSPRNDIFLMMEADFFLGSQSGLSHVAELFVDKVVITNVFPICDHPLKPTTKMIPKRSCFWRQLDDDEYERYTYASCTDTLLSLEVELLDSSVPLVERSVRECLAGIE